MPHFTKTISPRAIQQQLAIVGDQVRTGATETGRLARALLQVCRRTAATWLAAHARLGEVADMRKGLLPPEEVPFIYNKPMFLKSLQGLEERLNAARQHQDSTAEITRVMARFQDVFNEVWGMPMVAKASIMCNHLAEAASDGELALHREIEALRLNANYSNS